LNPNIGKSHNKEKKKAAGMLGRATTILKGVRKGTERGKALNSEGKSENVLLSILWACSPRVPKDRGDETGAKGRVGGSICLSLLLGKEKLHGSRLSQKPFAVAQPPLDVRSGDQEKMLLTEKKWGSEGDDGTGGQPKGKKRTRDQSVDVLWGDKS